MREELIINGERMDLSENTGITLEYRSNALGDITKIVGSYSYTISLPGTMHNRRVLGDPINISGGLAQTRRFLPARYLRNGVDLLGACRAAILSSGETIDVALYWGGLTFLQTWLGSDAKINAIPNSPVVSLSQTADLYVTMNERGYGTAAITPGIDLQTALQAGYPPAMRHDLILSGITSLIRTATQRPDFRFDLSQAGTTLDRWTPVQTLRSFRTPTSYFTTNTLRMEAFSSGVALLKGVGGTNPGNVYNYDTGFISVIESLPIHQVSIHLELRITGSFVPTGDPIMLTKESAYANDPNKSWPLQLNGGFLEGTIDDELEFSQGGAYRFRITGLTGVTTASYVEDDGQIMGITPIREVAHTGDEISIAKNLPDMKAIDFIKGICAFYGLVCMPDPKDEARVRLMSYAALLDESKAQAKDWTGKLQGNGLEHILRRAEYKVGSFTQASELKWRDDSKNPIDAVFSPGVISVPDATLPERSELATLPFAGTKNDIVPIYKMENSGDFNIEKLEPRLLSLHSELINSWTGPVVRTRLKADDNDALPNVIRSRYAALQRVLNNPIKLTVYVLLNEADLKDIDLAAPVYFRQLGHYYLIDRIKTDNSSPLSEVDLIQI